MNTIWLKIFGAMIGGSLVKSIIPNPYVWVGIDLVVLGIVYLILRQYPNVDIESSMKFLSGLTTVSILTDLGMVDGTTGIVLILAVVGWMLFKRRTNGKPKPPHQWHK